MDRSKNENVQIFMVDIQSNKNLKMWTGYWRIQFFLLFKTSVYHRQKSVIVEKFANLTD